MTRAQRWARAYARQAQADLRTWNLLNDRDETPQCHRLLFLQMACEKLTKAYLCQQGSDPDDLRSSHAYTAKNLPLIIRQRLSQKGRQACLLRIIPHTQHLAREIQALSPSVKDQGKRPENCEYPWKVADGRVHIPLDHTFPPAGLLTNPSGRIILKLISEAIDVLAS